MMAQWAIFLSFLSFSLALSSELHLDKDLQMDLLCLCRRFTSHNIGLTVKDEACNGWSERWQLVDLSKQAVDGIVSLDNGEMKQSATLQGGLHALAAQGPGNRLAIAFRHQEGDGLLDPDMWEAMSMWGRNFVQQSMGSERVVPCGALSELAKSIQRAIHWGLSTIKADYFNQGQSLVAAIQAHSGSSPSSPPSLIFTGYSMGGAQAQLQAALHNAPAIVFGSNGVKDIVKQLYPELLDRTGASGGEFTGQVNIVDRTDQVTYMDCQVAEYVCGLTHPLGLFQDQEEIHLDFVYGAGALAVIQADEADITCTSGAHYGGVCEGDACKVAGEL
ncbi:unnamed protein product [Chrysoparadoxa australica]